MLRQLCMFLLFVAFLSTEIHGRPSVRSGLKDCFEHACPANTYGCSKHSKISDDKKDIVSEIKCLDLHNQVLDKTTTRVPNDLGDGVFFEGYSYTAAYEFSDDDSNTAVETNKGSDRDVETNIIDNDKKESEGESEIDDLNRAEPEQQ